VVISIEKESREQYKRDRADELKNIMTKQVPALSELFSSGAFDDAIRQNVRGY